MGRTPTINWAVAEVYYLSLDPWFPGQLGRVGYDRSQLTRALRPRVLRRTYANVARRFGVSRQAVHQYASRHGWRERAREFDLEVLERVGLFAPAPTPDFTGTAVHLALADLLADVRANSGFDMAEIGQSLGADGPAVQVRLDEVAVGEVAAAAPRG